MGLLQVLFRRAQVAVHCQRRSGFDGKRDVIQALAELALARLDPLPHDGTVRDHVALRNPRSFPDHEEFFAGHD